MTTVAPGFTAKTSSGGAGLGGLMRRIWQSRMAYLFIAPFILHWLIFGAYPYVRGILIAFQDYQRFKPETWGLDSFNGLNNLIEFFKDPIFWPGLKAAFYLYIAVAPFTFILALFSAVLLNRVKNPKEAAIYRVIITLAWVIPEVAAMQVWRQIYEPNFGYLTHLVKDVLKLSSDPPTWTADKFWYWPCFAVASIWKGYGYNMLLFLLALYNIPTDLYDAAKIDGANGWQILRHVELPGIRNLMVLYLVTNVGWVGGGVTNVMLFGKGPNSVGETWNLYAFEAAFSQGSGRMGYSAAINFFSGVCNLIIAATVFKLLPSQKA